MVAMRRRMEDLPQEIVRVGIIREPGAPPDRWGVTVEQRPVVRDRGRSDVHLDTQDHFPQPDYPLDQERFHSLDYGHCKRAEALAIRKAGVDKQPLGVLGV